MSMTRTASGISNNQYILYFRCSLNNTVLHEKLKALRKEAVQYKNTQKEGYESIQENRRLNRIKQIRNEYTNYNTS